MNYQTQNILPGSQLDQCRFRNKKNGIKRHRHFLMIAARFPAAERPDLIHLGYDLTDETWTSSLLNCGVWEDELASIAQRVNGYGNFQFTGTR